MKDKKITKPNIVFLVIDDLRPELNVYGKTQIISPNIDKLSSKGTTFLNAFCNVPVCGASRASVLTGVRPTAKRFLDYDTRLDDEMPKITSLPELFKNNGYTTISLGKVFHFTNDHKQAWSVKPFRPKTKGKERDYINQETFDNFEDWDLGDRIFTAGPAWEIGNTEDDAQYKDGVIAEKAIASIDTLKNSDKPFFLAVGFFKPHLPFNAPRKYYDLYDRDSLELAENQYIPKDAPPISIIDSRELRLRYTGVPENRILPEDYALSLQHGYFASVSYIDAQIGKVIDKLNDEGLADNTIIVLWGDHGFNLGEHSIWGKHNTFETALRAPLIISAPGYLQNKKTASLAEFVDIYPTLTDLAELQTPSHVQGTSLASILKNPEISVKDAVFARWKTGESIRTKSYAYTEWRNPKTKEIEARMLYDLENDPDENSNIVKKEAYSKVVEQLSKRLNTHISNRE